jgi:hypothetical protein
MKQFIEGMFITLANLATAGGVGYMFYIWLSRG